LVIGSKPRTLWRTSTRLGVLAQAALLRCNSNFLDHARVLGREREATCLPAAMSWAGAVAMRESRINTESDRRKPSLAVT